MSGSEGPAGPVAAARHARLGMAAGGNLGQNSGAPGGNTTIKIVAGTTGAELVGADAKAPKNVYNAQGMLLIKNATPEQIEALGTGFYIVGNQKKVVRK